jgi:two-component system response regulator YesN
MTPTYFCRFFRKVTGKTLTEYLLCMRIDKGMELLFNGNQSVTEIAYAVGFGSHSYFDRVFRRLTGRAPLEFRKTAGASTRK